MQKQNLYFSFPGRDQGILKRVNIARLYDHQYNKQLATIYKKVDMNKDRGEYDAIDVPGYTGNFHREKQTLVPISEDEFFVEIANSNNFQKMILMVN
jgi:hypothetical protein